MQSQLGASSRLPDDVVSALRATFADELQVRLPRLRAVALGVPPDEVSLRDAHVLGSSATVVGDGVAAGLARRLEQQVPDGRSEDVRATAASLVARLEAWTA